MKQEFFLKKILRQKKILVRMRVNFRRPVSNEMLDRKGLGNEELANGVLYILDGWAANREANFMTAKLVLIFARTSGLAMENWHLICNREKICHSREGGDRKRAGGFNIFKFECNFRTRKTLRSMARGRPSMSPISLPG